MTIKNILVVDDGEAEQFLSRRLIGKYDRSINVMSAYDGRDALEMLETVEEVPEVILLDINMPRMGGLEFLEIFSKLYEDTKIKVAMFSSSVREKDVAFGYKCVFSYFEKPLSVDHLDILAGMDDTTPTSENDA